MIVENDWTILQIFKTDDRETNEEANMDSKHKQQAKREARTEQANRDELVERITRRICEDGTVFTGGCKRILRQGYRTILQRLVRAGMINLTAAESLFGPPSYDSAHWALLTGRRPAID